jgi:CubicO group peptidase (beta-lactamase class C family)
MRANGAYAGKTVRYPAATWPRLRHAEEAGFDSRALKDAKRWLNGRVGRGRYRVVIIRGGYLVAEWNHGVGRHEQLRLASAAKSIFSCILGIAIERGTIPSADAKVVDYYPEAMDVPEGEGPKPGRYAFEKDRAMTFRQLISNTSGYMKPGEEPGKAFHYQTYGMNILTHAIANLHGFYDIRDPAGSPGLQPLVDAQLRIPIRAMWSYYKMNFSTPGRLPIFGYYDGVQATALDMARLGWLWCNWGSWRDRQLVPETWLRTATQTAPDIRTHCPREQWRYGYGFWTNEHGQLWPSLPLDSYAASGAGARHIWVCPSLDLVVVQSPGLWQDQVENDTGLLRLVVDACV